MCEEKYNDYRKRKLSASSDGRGIAVAVTATPGTLVHQALASTAANEWDEVFINAINTSTSAVKLTIEWGGTTVSDGVEITIPPEAGFTQVIAGHVLQNNREVRAFAASAGVIVLHGYVNRYERTP